MKRTTLILTFLFVINSIYGQDLFKTYGIQEPLTLSKGRYKETFPNKETVQIGTVLLNTKTNKIIEFLEEDSTEYAYQAEYSTRWLSPDPLAEKYPQLSPYVFCANNPLRYIDPDGRMLNDYTVDVNGNVELAKITKDNFDILYNKEGYEAGKRDYDDSGTKSGIKIEKGEVKNINHVKIHFVDSGGDRIGEKTTYDKYEVTSDIKATNILNFLDKNTNVEWGNVYAETSTGDKINIILTSHQESTVGNATVGFLERYLGKDHKIIRDDHIHPSGNSQPSGEKGDIGRTKDILKYSPNARFRILTNGKYYEYNQKGLIK
jgi:hypothetical protein